MQHRGEPPKIAVYIVIFLVFVVIFALPFHSWPALVYVSAAIATCLVAVKPASAKFQATSMPTACLTKGFKHAALEGVVPPVLIVLAG